MSTSASTSSPSFPQAGRACAKRVAIALPIAIALFALVGKAIEERAAIKQALLALWDEVLWLTSIGGHFWGAVAVGIAALCGIAWAICVRNSLSEECPAKVERTLTWIGLAAFAVFLLATFALHITYDDFDSLTVYQSIAVCIMWAPFGACGIVAIGAAILGFHEACAE